MMLSNYTASKLLAIPEIFIKVSKSKLPKKGNRPDNRTKQITPTNHISLVVDTG